MTMIAENTPDCSDQDSGLPIPESQARQLRPGLSAGTGSVGMSTAAQCRRLA